MKVIVAGYAKTGTKSMHVALRELGYNVYDHFEHYVYHGDEWKVLLTNGGSIEDFKLMYKDVDAVMDTPANFFWEEIHWAFPDAKIILTLRDEDEWWASVCKQVQVLTTSKLYVLFQFLSPTGRRFFYFRQNYILVVFGFYAKYPWLQTHMNEMVQRKKYRQHNAHVLQNAPKDKLLVYNVKEGWKPLCEFLGKDVPNKPFPHKNKNGSVIEEAMRTHPAIIRMKREMYITTSLLFGLGICGAYLLYKRYLSWYYYAITDKAMVLN